MKWICLFTERIADFPTLSYNILPSSFTSLLVKSVLHVHQGQKRYPLAFGRNLPVEAILGEHSLPGGGAVVECIQFSYLLSQSVQADLDLLRSGYFFKELKFSCKMIVHENFNLMVCVSGKNT